MGVILSLSGIGAYRALIQANWTALEREIESIAGTLHDSVEPLLPRSEDLTAVLQQIFPELCLVGQPCDTTPTLIQRHTIGISDRSTYYIRLFDDQGNLLAFSQNQPSQLPETLPANPWQTFQTEEGLRYRQFTILLHSANTPHSPSRSNWGYLQIGRSLAHFDAGVIHIQRILLLSLPLVLGLIVVSSWWLSGLAMRPIYQSYQQQQQFTADAAHELRTPLASLLATIESLLRVPSTSPEDTKQLLSQIEKQGRRISHLIADLLNLTNIEQYSTSQPFQPCCLNDIVSDLTEEFLELADGAEIQLTSQIPHQPIYVRGNEQQLYRLISNLIANAIQYTPAGGKVEVSLELHDHTACIRIVDTGIGICAEEQKHIFDRFYRVNRDRSQQTGGTGLGLAIAQAIAQVHGGQLSVESQLYQGSAFTLQLSRVTKPGFWGKY